MPKKCAEIIKHYLTGGDRCCCSPCKGAGTRPRQQGKKADETGLNGIYAVTLTLIIKFKKQAG